MVINLTTLAPIAAAAGGAILFLVWLFYSRTRRGLLYLLAGWILELAALRSDGKPTTLAGIAIVGGLLVALLTATQALIIARRRRVPYYVPPEQRRRSWRKRAHPRTPIYTTASRGQYAD